MDISQMPQRYVIFHRPGPKWRDGVPPNEQEGVLDHFAYLQGVDERGAILLSGPFIDGTGGMIVTKDGVTGEQAQAILDNDPGIKTGLITGSAHLWINTFDRR